MVFFELPLWLFILFDWEKVLRRLFCARIFHRVFWETLTFYKTHVIIHFKETDRTFLIKKKKTRGGEHCFWWCFLPFSLSFLKNLSLASLSLRCGCWMKGVKNSRPSFFWLKGMIYSFQRDKSTLDLTLCEKRAAAFSFFSKRLWLYSMQFFEGGAKTPHMQTFLQQRKVTTR